MADVESDAILQGDVDGVQDASQHQELGDGTDDAPATMIEGASPVARPHSRGSVTPRKVILIGIVFMMIYVLCFCHRPIC